MKGPGESRSDLWQIVEFSKYFKTDEVWGEELLAQMPEYRGKTLYEVLYENGEVNKYKVPTDVRDISMMKPITSVTTYKKVYSKNTQALVVVMVMT